MALETTATFIGHNECFGLSSEKLKNAIRELIEKGVTDFLSGGQGGFDRLCGRCVYELKKEYPHINNYLVIPYLSFNVYDKELFDSIIYPDGFEKYNFKSAIPARNRYMVDNSGYAICFVTHSWGGAAKTYERAKKKKLRIINLSCISSYLVSGHSLSIASTLLSTVFCLFIMHLRKRTVGEVFTPPTQAFLISFCF